MQQQSSLRINIILPLFCSLTPTYSTCVLTNTQTTPTNTTDTQTHINSHTEVENTNPTRRKSLSALLLGVIYFSVVTQLITKEASLWTNTQTHSETQQMTLLCKIIQILQVFINAIQ